MIVAQYSQRHTCAGIRLGGARATSLRGAEGDARSVRPSHPLELATALVVKSAVAQMMMERMLAPAASAVLVSLSRRSGQQTFQISSLAKRHFAVNEPRVRLTTFQIGPDCGN